MSDITETIAEGTIVTLENNDIDYHATYCICVVTKAIPAALIAHLNEAEDSRGYGIPNKLKALIATGYLQRVNGALRLDGGGLDSDRVITIEPFDDID